MQRENSGLLEIDKERYAAEQKERDERGREEEGKREQEREKK